MEDAPISMEVRGSALFVIMVLPDGQCAACDEYKTKEHRNFVEALKRDKRFGLVVYECSLDSSEQRRLSVVNTIPGIPGPIDIMNGRITPDVVSTPHPDLYSTYWEWWPNFMIFNVDDFTSRNSSLVKSAIFCGKLTPSTQSESGYAIVESEMGLYYPSADNLSKWATLILDKYPELYKRVELPTYTQHKKIKVTAKRF